MITKIARIKKAVAGGVAGAISGAGTLIAMGVLDGSAKFWVLGFIAAAQPLLNFLGVYKAPPNDPPA